MNALRAAYRRWNAEHDQGEQQAPSCASSGLVDEHLTPDSALAGRMVELSLISPVGRRAVAVFLGRGDYEKVEHVFPALMADLLLECFSGFVHARGGQIAFAVRMSNEHCGTVNPVLRTVTLDGHIRRFLRDGFLFVRFSDERVVVSAREELGSDGQVIIIDTRSNLDSAAFFSRWQQYAKEHSYLRGRAFFADGEIIERKSTYSWQDILLPDETKLVIQNHVESFLRNRQALRQLGVKPRRGLILSGPPGTGKTLLGKVLADTLDSSFLWVSPRHIRNPASFEDILSLARFVSPAVLFLEDLDLFAQERESQGSMGLGELMNQLDGAVDNEDIVTIATTNRLEAIETALRNRPGRFDRILCFSAMDEHSRRALLNKLLSKAAIGAEDLNYLVGATDQFTGAQLQEVANTLYILSVNGKGQETSAAAAAEPLVTVDRPLIDAALNEMRVARKSGVGFQAA